MSDRDAIIELLQDPGQLKKLFQPQDEPPPAARTPDISLPEAIPRQRIRCRVEVRLRASFDPWEIDRLSQNDIESVVWAVLTRDPDYYGGVDPDLRYVSMHVERLPDESIRTNNATQPTRDRHDHGDADDHPGGGSESDDAGGPGAG